MADNRISERELKFILALAGGYPPTRAAVEAGFSTGHAKNLLKREAVRDAAINLAGNLMAVVLKHYR